MAITTDICTSFMEEMPVAEHDFTTSTGDTFRWALYTSAATLDATTTAYTVTNEASGTGYAAGGATSASVTPVNDSGTIVFDFADVTWAGSTITARGCMLYNDTHASNASVAIWDFGSDQSSSSGDFTLQMPTADASNAILRLA